MTNNRRSLDLRQRAPFRRGRSLHCHSLASILRSALRVGGLSACLALALIWDAASAQSMGLAPLPESVVASGHAAPLDPNAPRQVFPPNPAGSDAGPEPGLAPGAAPVEQTGIVRTTEDIGLPPGDAPDATERSEAVNRPTVRTVVPGEEGYGLTRESPIPLGWTCSCTIDRVGTLSQFDVTVLQVVRNAYPMIQQLNRFNPQPRPQHAYVGVYVGQKYVAGPENLAYTVAENDFKAATTGQTLLDTVPLLRTPTQYRLQYDVYPGAYVNGWLFYELPTNRPALLAWHYSYFGERAIWFALQ